MKKKKNNPRGAEFLIFARCPERLLQFEKAIRKVICQMIVFMQPKTEWELEWDGMLMLFLVLYGPKVKLAQIKNVPGGSLISLFVMSWEVPKSHTMK